MADLFGYWIRDDRPADPSPGEELLRSIRDVLSPGLATDDRTVAHLHAEGGFGFGLVGRRAELESHVPEVGSGEIVAIAGRPHAGEARVRAGAVANSTSTATFEGDAAGWAGKFAAVRFDRERARLRLVRDRMGQKPLFWWERGSLIAFATTVKALLVPAWRALGKLRVEPDAGGLAHYVMFQTTLENRTLYRGISRVPPGGLLDVAPKSIEVRIPSSPEEGRDPVPDGERHALLLHAIRVSARRELPEGGDLAVLLSGGLDSSTTSVLAAQAFEGTVRSYTGYFGEGPEYDERPFASAVATAIGSRHREILITAEDYGSRLEATFDALDQPMAGPGAVSQWIVGEHIDPATARVLTGEGGDELFGGYARLKVCHELSRGTDRAELATRLAPLGDYRPLVARLDAAGTLTAEEAYVHLVTRSSFDQPPWHPDFVAHLRAHDPLATLRAEIASGSGDGALERILEFERRRLLPMLLELDDLLLSRAGVPGACPLLGPEVLTAVSRFSVDELFATDALKPVLRRAVASVLPDAVSARTDKKGFPLPLQQWARGPLRDRFADLLLSREARERGVLDPRAAEKLLDTETPYARSLWGAVSLEMWFRQIDRRGRALLD